jgi:Taurine catabolism dioxygenase TauD, TfdA family
MGECASELSRHGFAWIRGCFGSAELAFDEARCVAEECCVEEDLPPIAVVGDFILPPPDGSLSRDFQTLHLDFGVPLDSQVVQDVARYTALYIPSDRRDVFAVTRIVSLSGLLSQRPWPCTQELVERLVGYGTTHGAWPDANGYVEGSLARIVEAATGAAPVLPSVKVDPDFLCGMEFANLEAELRFFDQHGLHVEAAQTEVPLGPGDLLIFDNLAVAHGRRGTRQPGELRQRIFGHPRLDVSAQRQLRDHVLRAFAAPAEGREGHKEHDDMRTGHKCVTNLAHEPTGDCPRLVFPG